MKKIIKWCLPVIFVVIVMAVILNRVLIVDWFRGLFYTPSPEVDVIMKDLRLTGRGELLFKSARPVLNDRDEFNEHCRAGSEKESAVLGCFTNDSIYVYNITSDELDGIRELTMAHELLHMAWSRMSDGEKNELMSNLNRVLNENQETLASEIDIYDTKVKQEELYVRAGTEIKRLPEVLEKHYATIFSDQDRIVGFYDKYIGVFHRLENEIKDLREQIENLNTEIENKTIDYGQRVSELNTAITEFNECAGTAGCFENQWDFSSKRLKLIAEQSSLGEIYEGINKLVENYNNLIERYNADVIHSDKLNSVINSAVEPETVK